MTNKDLSIFSNEKVLQFYKELPFNYYSSVEEQSKNILLGEQNFKIYGPLVNELKKANTIIDVGCGAGYLANSISYVYPKKNILGIDFNSVATKRATEVSKYLKLNSEFKSIDLFKYSKLPKFDLALSIGVLMHTNNFFEGLKHIIKEMLNEGGKIYIGLYNKFGRKPFLDYFKVLKERGLSETDLFERYAKLHKDLKDKTHLKSWFRDQILHPHETQHSIREIITFLENLNFKVSFTSINKFKRISYFENGYNKDELNSLYLDEKNMENIGREALKENRYYPGFFTFLAEPK